MKRKSVVPEGDLSFFQESSDTANVTQEETSQQSKTEVLKKPNEGETKSEEKKDTIER